LSQKRAQAVRTVLQQNGVKPNQVQIEGFGKSQPIAPNTSAEGRAKNRRVELRITDSEASEQKAE
ncbi:MAG: OmpA family protein, partial [Proteobacteria bacterium]